jgi:hypothetical protein
VNGALSGTISGWLRPEFVHHLDFHPIFGRGREQLLTFGVGVDVVGCPVIAGFSTGDVYKFFIFYRCRFVRENINYNTFVSINRN